MWIDLEMTGLDTERHTIVEIAVLITDSALELVDDGIDLVIHATPAELERMDDFVRNMHTKSGLLPQIEAVDAVARGRRRRRCSSTSAPASPRTPRRSAGTRSAWTGGSSTATCPAVDRYVHYRSIDVSSLKELCRRWNPGVYKGRPGKRETHRALDDIRESLEELRYYRDQFLQLPRSTGGPPRRPRARGAPPPAGGR